MTGPTLARIAWRNLWRNKRRSFLTLISIAFGGLLAVLFTAMQDRSFSDFIDTAARLGNGHVTIQHPEYLDTPTLSRSVEGGSEFKKFASLDADVEIVVERISGEAMVSTADDSFGVRFIAYDPEQETEETLSFQEGLVEGEMFGSSRDKGIILGKKLAQNLSLELGRKVVFTMTDKNGEIVSGLARLSGIIGTGAPSLDKGLCLLPIDVVRDLLGYQQDECTHLAVFISDSRRSVAVADRIQVALQDATALTWDEIQPELSGFIAMKVGGAIFMEIIIAILVAAGIFNTLFVSVMERLREFGIMVAIGYSPGQLFRLVMWESLWLAVMGLLTCAVLTAGPYAYLVRTGLDYSAMTGGDAVEIAGVGWDPVIRIGIFPEHLLVIIAAMVFATLAAGLYPAWKAGRVEPVETIRLV